VIIMANNITITATAISGKNGELSVSVTGPDVSALLKELEKAIAAVHDNNIAIGIIAD